jgi:hypothetical protein
MRDDGLRNGRFAPILLQKSKIASGEFLVETLKSQAIGDSDNLSRATEGTSKSPLDNVIG